MKLSDFNKTSVYVMFNKGDSEDSYDPKQNWECVEHLKADIQSYSGGLAQKEYGLTVDCQKRIYTQESDFLDEGVGVAIDETAQEPEYIVKYVERWDSYTMAILQKR